VAGRYAIYYAPEPGSDLAAFGVRWTGSSDDGKSVPAPDIPGISPSRFAELTVGPRRYGFHGTLKPPFVLNPGATPANLIAAAQIVARGLAPIVIPPLEIQVIGKFIALTPSSSSAELEKLAAQCVRAFEAYRNPLSEEQVATYRANKLTVHQDSMLEHWGYPYVMEEFRFHISLTERIDDIAERRAMMQAVIAMTAPIADKPVTIRDLALFHQTGRDEPMKLLQRFPFGRAK
jgi:putative phosphonate metabolism protein